MTRDSLCPSCAWGPDGIEGHAEMMVLAVGDAEMSFKCARCRALWSRTGEYPRGYAWLRFGGGVPRSGETGVSVPPRSRKSLPHMRSWEAFMAACRITSGP